MAPVDRRRGRRSHRSGRRFRTGRAVWPHPAGRNALDAEPPIRNPVPDTPPIRAPSRRRANNPGRRRAKTRVRLKMAAPACRTALRTVPDSARQVPRRSAAPASPRTARTVPPADSRAPERQAVCCRWSASPLDPSASSRGRETE